jgi:integrase/recombinase XerC
LPVPFDLRDEAERRGTKILATFLAGCQSPHTRRAYAEDFRVFRRFCERAYGISLSAAQVVDRFVFGGQRHGARSNAAHAYELTTWFRAWQLDQDKAAATINRRLTMLRGLVRIARRLGYLTWALDIDPVKGGMVRDTSGPPLEDLRRLLASLARDRSPMGRRDLAIVRLLYDVSLRREEIARLTLADLDLQQRRLHVRGKGNQHHRLTLPQPTCEALADWLNVRGLRDGPLFLLVSSRGGAVRWRSVTGSSLYKMIRTRGAAVGIRTRPHGLRHAGITQACEIAAAKGIGIEQVRLYSRHSRLETLMVYRDASTSQNVQEQLAAAVAARSTDT